MYKILNSRGLGVAGKQNELIELALTHGFHGVEVDMVDLVGRHDTLGKEFACQFLQSADIDLGTFKLPIDLGGLDEKYQASIAKLDTILDLATTLKAKCCYVEIGSVNENFAFQDNFQKHQSRLQELAEKFAESGIKIGLALKATPGATPDGTFKFIQTADEILTLVKAVGQPNIGLCLDTWEWVIGGGTTEQLAEAGLEKVITEIRLADVTADADLAKIKSSQRTAMPGDTAGSFSVAVCQLVAKLSEPAFPISIATDLSTYADGQREATVGKLSKQLDLLIAGEDPAAIAQAALDAEAAEAAADDAEGEEQASAEKVATS